MRKARIWGACAVASLGLLGAACVPPVTGPPNIAPIAVATATPETGDAPLEVQFSSAGSVDPDGSIFSYAWDFGDGGTSTAADPVHTYAAAGTYTATLKVTDNRAAWKTATVTVTVTNAPPPNVAPTAAATATPTAGQAPLEVAFDSAGSVDTDGTIESYEWDFGDSNAGSGATTSHTYTTAGTYTATLTVTDDDGATGTASVTVSVSPADDPNGRYVSAAGTDAGDCSTSAAPCLTIGYAVGQAVAGNTVYVAAGAYPELVSVTKALSFRGANAGIAGSGTRGLESVVKGFRTPGNPGTTQIDVTIDGFQIDPQGDTALISASLQPLVWLRGGANGVTVTNNVFDGGPTTPNCSFNCTTMTDAAFGVHSGTVDFSDNLVTDFRRPINIQQPVGAPATNATVADNVITNFTSRAVSIAGSTGVQMLGQTVSGNLISGAGYVAPSGPAGMTISNQGNTVTGNTITGVASGVYVDLCKKFVTNNNSIVNNTITGNGGGVNISVNTDGGQCVNSATEGSGGWVVGGGRLNGLTITGNDLSGNTNYAIRHAAYNWGFFTATAPISAGPFDASCNWYGTATGPEVISAAYPPGTVPTGTFKVINTDAPHAQLTTTPWLTSAGGACDGGA